MILGLTSKWMRKHLLSISPSLTLHMHMHVSKLKVSFKMFLGQTEILLLFQFFSMPYFEKQVFLKCKSIVH